MGTMLGRRSEEGGLVICMRLLYIFQIYCLSRSIVDTYNNIKFTPLGNNFTVSLDIDFFTEPKVLDKQLPSISGPPSKPSTLSPKQIIPITLALHSIK
jgi:hypothetical protein